MAGARRGQGQYVAIGLSLAFVFWSATFIYRSSFIAIDGKRYFCLFDDAMISMRYAWHLSHGFGLVWNPGEPTQGFTNLLMTLLMSLVIRLSDKATAPLLVQILGVVFMLAIAFLTMRLADGMRSNDGSPHREVVKALSFACALSYYPLLYWSLMGMETGLLTLLLLLAIVNAFGYIRQKREQNLWWVSLCLGLAYLTRNDSVVFATLIWAYLAWELFAHAPRGAGRSSRQLAVALGVYGVFIAGQFLFQYSYYGELWPNTYTLKLTGLSLPARLRDGVGFVSPFVVSTSVMLGLASVNVARDRRPQKVLLLAIAVAALCYQVYVGGDPWAYWRIMSPSMPLVGILFVAEALSIEDVALRIPPVHKCLLRSPSISRVTRTGVFAIALTAIGLWRANRAFWPEIRLAVPAYTVASNQLNVNTAVALERLTSTDATVGVFWAGAIPYFTGRRAVDFLGKSDRYIAHLPPDVSGRAGWSGMRSVPGHNKYDLNYSIRSVRPTYVQGFQFGTQDLTQWAEKRYSKVEFEGVSLFLLRGSPKVLWTRLRDGK